MVKAQLRSLEKKLVYERAETEIEVLVYNFILEWEIEADYEKPLPDPHKFIMQLFDSGFYLRTCAKAQSYLYECQRDRKVPEPKRLLQILIPWRNR